MNVSDDVLLARYLRGLPEANPPAALGVRVAQTCARRRRLRRWLPPVAIAASVAMVGFVPAWFQPRALPDAAVSTPVAQSADEPYWRNRVALAELRALDRSLQSAYLSSSHDGPAVNTLWQARGQVATRLEKGEPVSGLMHL